MSSHDQRCKEAQDSHVIPRSAVIACSAARLDYLCALYSRLLNTSQNYYQPCVDEHLDLL
jgi:hypothetical protein